MNVSRRQFISWGLAAGAALSVEGVGQAFYGHVMRTSKRMDAPIPTACRACPAGCGIVGYTRDKTRLVAIMGNPEHPASQGRVCALAPAAINLHQHPERLWQTRRRDGGVMETPAAIEAAARRIAELAANGATVVIDTWDEQRWHADFLAALGGRGKLIGREALAGWQRSEIMSQVWGAEVRPDFEKTDLLLVFGDEPLDHGPRFILDARRIVEARVERGMKLIVFDPRLSNTGGKADLWLPIRPGTERTAALALVRHALESANLSLHVSMRGQRVSLYHLAEALDIYTFEYAAQACGVAPELFEAAGRLLSEARQPATMVGDRVFDGPDAQAAYAAISLFDLLGGTQQIPVMPKPRFAARESLCDPVEAEEIYRALERGAGDKLVLITQRANPVYERGRRLEGALANRAAAFHLALSPLPNETTALADLLIPEALPIESDGRVWLTSHVPTPTYVELQPIAAPPKGVLSAREIFAGLGKALPEVELTPAYDLREVQELTGSEHFFEIARGIHAGDAEYLPAMSYQVSLSFFAELGVHSPALPAPGHAILLTHGGPVTNQEAAQAKWLAEIEHAARLFVNPDDAKRFRLRQGDWAQVSLDHATGAEAALPLRVMIQLSEGVRPGCVSLLAGQGHEAAGRLAMARHFPSRLDPDMKLIWWEDEGNGANPSPLLAVTAAAQAPGAALPPTHVRIRRA